MLVYTRFRGLAATNCCKLHMMVLTTTRGCQQMLVYTRVTGLATSQQPWSTGSPPIFQQFPALLYIMPWSVENPQYSNNFHFFHFSSTLECRKPPVFQQFPLFPLLSNPGVPKTTSIPTISTFSTSQQPWTAENPQYSNNFHFFHFSATLECRKPSVFQQFPLFPLLSNPGLQKTHSIPTISTFSTSQQPWSAENPQYIVGILGVFCTPGLLRN